MSGYADHEHRRAAARASLVKAIVDDVTFRVGKSPAMQRDPDAIFGLFNELFDREAERIADAKQEAYSVLADRFPILRQEGAVKR